MKVMNITKDSTVSFCFPNDEQLTINPRQVVKGVNINKLSHFKDLKKFIKIYWENDSEKSKILEAGTINFNVGEIKTKKPTKVVTEVVENKETQEEDVK